MPTTNVKQIGFFLPHLGQSQLAFYIINQINYLLNKTNEYDFVLFYEHLMRPCIEPNCSILNPQEIWSFNGMLVSTTLENAAACINTINQSKNVFYVWDLDWLRQGKNNYIYNLSILRNPKLTLVARSKDHAQAIENYCNRKVDAIVSDCNIEEMSKLWNQT